MNSTPDISHEALSKHYQNRVFFYFVLVFTILLAILKLPMARVYYETVSTLITFAPLLVILVMAILSYLKEKKYPDYQVVIRKFYLVFTLKFLLAVLLFYIFYSPSVFTLPILAFFRYFRILATPEGLFFSFSYASTLVISLAIIFVCFRAYQKTKKTYRGSISGLVKKTLYTLFVFFFVILATSALAYPKAYEPITNTAGDIIYTISVGKIQVLKGDNVLAYNKIGSLEEFLSALFGSIFKTSQNISQSNQNFSVNLTQANQDLKNSIVQSSQEFSEKVKADLGGKLSIKGGTVGGSIILSGETANLIVGGTTTTKDIIPESDLDYNLGSSGKSWDTVYAHRLIGSSPIFIGEGSSDQGLNGDGDLVVTGDAEVQGKLSIGNYSLPARDGGADQVLVTDGAGNVSWGAGGAEDGTYVAIAGDTMTGTLILPSNGLTVGSDELVVSSGRVGINTDSPNYPLTVNGDINLTSGSKIRINGTQIGINNLKDVSASDATTNQVLSWNGTRWVNMNLSNISTAGNSITFYPENQASDVGGYKELLGAPGVGSEVDHEETVNDNFDSPALFEEYASAPDGIGKSQIDGGEWEFDTFSYVENNPLADPLAESRIQINVYKRAADGDETLLFSVSTDPITSTEAEETVKSSVQSAFDIDPTDRLVVKYYAKTSQVVDTVVHFLHNGDSHYSHFHTPMVTGHNDLVDLQGGTSDEYYHLTANEYTGTGTGIFARQTAPTFLTSASAPRFISTVATGTAPLTVSSTTLVSNLNADLLDGQQGSYYLNTGTNFGGDVSGAYNAIVVANDSHSHTSATLPANISYLGSSIDLASEITGTLPIANGGTGSTTGSITGTGSLTFTAGGDDQDVIITPSGSGHTLLNGSVGIGATSPLANLDINGDAILSGANNYLNFGSTSGSSGYGFYDASGTLQYKNSGGSWTNLVSSQWTTNGNDIYYNAGFVGLGTNIPSAKVLNGFSGPLALSAQYPSITMVSTNSLPYKTWQLGVDGAGAISWVNDAGQIAWTLNHANGYMAVGQVNGYYANNYLDVAGGMAIGSGYTGITNAKTAPTNGLIVEGNVGIGQYSPSALLDLVGNGPTLEGTATLDDATGNEVAYQLNYTTNKATSGDDTGLLIQMTDTASPGTSHGLTWKKGAVTQFDLYGTNGGVLKVGSDSGGGDDWLVLDGAGNHLYAYNGTSLLLSGSRSNSAGNGITLNPSFVSDISLTSGQYNSIAILPVYNQLSGTAANTDLLINRTQTAVGSGAQLLIDAQVGNVSKFKVDNAGLVTANGGTFTGGTTTLGTTYFGAAGGAGMIEVGATAYFSHTVPWVYAQRYDNSTTTPTFNFAQYDTDREMTGSSVAQAFFQINPEWLQTGTSSGTDLLINRTQTSVGSGAQYLIDAQVGGVSKFSVSNTGAVTLAAGTTAIGTAPLKFTAGTNLSAAEAGAMEWDGTNLFVTQTAGPTRKTIAYTSDITPAQWVTSTNDIYYTAGKVGIGTVSPAEKLHVANGTLLVDTPTNPTLEGALDTGISYGVYVSGKYAYMADSVDGLHIVDISVPSAPVLTGTYNTSGEAYDVKVEGKYAYVADDGAGLQIIDVSNPTSPSLTGTYNSSGSCRGLYVSGKYAYLADGEGIKIVDVSNPVSPTLTGIYSSSGFTLGVYVVGKYAYLADYDYGVRVVDVSNPASPTLVTTLDTAGLANKIYVSGKYAYVADNTYGLRVMDISTTPPTLTGTYDTGNAKGVYVSGKYAYVSDITNGLVVVDVSNPASPSLVGNYAATPSNGGIYISGKYAYLASDAAGLQIIDLGGADIHALTAGNLNASDATIWENMDVGNDLNVRGALNVGFGGIFTNGDISANGTIRGQNFLTTGGTPVNDILLPQEVANYSINSLSGSIGLGASSAIEAKVAETSFDSTVVSNVSAAQMQNGNMFIVYRHNDGSGAGGYFMIYNSSGSVVKAETAFDSSGLAGDASATSLNNGNVLIAYPDSGSSNYGTLVIYDPSGNLVTGPTQFTSGGIGTAGVVKAFSLTNGNIVIAYSLASDSDGYFVIYDQAGNLVKSQTAFMASVTTDKITGVAMTDGNFSLIARNTANSNKAGRYLYNSAGGLISSSATFLSNSNRHIALQLNNGNIFVAYQNGTNPFAGTFVIYDRLWNIVVSATAFEDTNTQYLSGSVLPNGNVLLAYMDAGDSNQGKYVIYNQAGTQVVAPTVFESSSISGVDTVSVTLTDGSVAVIYYDTVATDGQFITYQSTGASFSNDVYLTAGNLGIGTTTFGANSISVLGIKNGTIPADSPADMIQLYAEDNAGSSELKVRDEAGNITVLSPHNFSLISNGPSEEMAWSYYSEKDDKAINADMTKALRLIEKISGQKLVYIQDLETGEANDTASELGSIFALDELNLQQKQIQDISLKTDQSITTLKELQSSIDKQLSLISENLNNLEEDSSKYESKLNSLESIVSTLQTQLTQLQSKANAEFNLAQIDLNTADLTFLKLLLGTDRVKSPEDLDILGKLSSKTLSTGGIEITIIDEDAPTIGSATIKPADTDSDGKSVIVKTKAVGEKSKIYLTPISSTENKVLYVGKIDPDKSFEVKVDDAVKAEVEFNWWIISAE